MLDYGLEWTNSSLSKRRNIYVNQIERYTSRARIFGFLVLSTTFIISWLFLFFKIYQASSSSNLCRFVFEKCTEVCTLENMSTENEMQIRHKTIVIFEYADNLKFIYKNRYRYSRDLAPSSWSSESGWWRREGFAPPPSLRRGFHCGSTTAAFARPRPPGPPTPRSCT